MRHFCVTIIEMLIANANFQTVFYFFNKIVLQGPGPQKNVRGSDIPGVNSGWKNTHPNGKQHGAVSLRKIRHFHHKIENNL